MSGDIRPSTQSWPMRGVPMSAPRAKATELAAQIEAMLSIYFQPEESEEAARLSRAMWRDVLSDLPAEAISRAIMNRVRSPLRSRPIPGEIREMALAELDHDECAALEADRIMARRIDHAKDWLSRHDTIAQWMDDLVLADFLLADGYDYDRLRDAGFSLPARGRLVDISSHMKKIGALYPSKREVGA